MEQLLAHAGVALLKQKREEEAERTAVKGKAGPVHGPNKRAIICLALHYKAVLSSLQHQFRAVATTGRPRSNK